VLPVVEREGEVTPSFGIIVFQYALLRLGGLTPRNCG